jgi:hypothetical protein
MAPLTVIWIENPTIGKLKPMAELLKSKLRLFLDPRVARLKWSASSYVIWSHRHVVHLFAKHELQLEVCKLMPFFR